MDEPNPKPLAKETQAGTTPEPTKTDASIALELAFARGSGHISDSVPERIDRPEHSVMEGLPQAKAERIASVYREVAELQRQLSTAQQRIATELQGRAEDAERYDALESHLEAHELKAQQATTRVVELETEIADLRTKLASATATGEELRRDVAGRDVQIEEARRQHKDGTEQLEVQSSSLREAKALLLEAKTLLETRDAELATRTTERDTEQTTRSRLEGELETERTQHREAIATRDAQLTAMTTERDAHKGELEKVRRELEAGRAKARDVASQLVRFGQELDGAGIAMPHAERPHRSQPPPVPTAKATAHTDARQVETILEVTEVPKPSSRLRSVLMILVGVMLGCGVTIAIAKATNESTTPDERADVGGPPPAALATQPAVESAPAPIRVEASADPTAPAAQATPASNTDENTARPAASAQTNADGVILLPEDAAGHRVFVDGRVVDVNGSRAVVPCGTHEVRIGSRGTPRTFDVACGGETAIPAETPDR